MTYDFNSHLAGNYQLMCNPWQRDTLCFETLSSIGFMSISYPMALRVLFQPVIFCLASNHCDGEHLHRLHDICFANLMHRKEDETSSI